MICIISIPRLNKHKVIWKQVRAAKLEGYACHCELRALNDEWAKQSLTSRDALRPRPLRKTATSQRLSYVTLLPAPASIIQGDSHQQYQADDNLMPIGIDVEHHHFVLHGPDQGCANEDTNNAAFATHQADTAQNTGSDRQEFVAFSRGGMADAQTCSLNHANGGGAHHRDDVTQDDAGVHLNARQTRRLAIAAGCVDLSANIRIAEQIK